jgi:dTDP-4-dehydrorhamnose reductase
MKVLLTGSNGLLGQKLVEALRVDPAMELLATSRGPDRSAAPLGPKYLPLDITDASAVDAVFDAFSPEVVIHTAAMTNVDACELDPAACTLQNVTATKNLLSAAIRHDSHFIFLSTDFIFDGKAGPYKRTMFLRR